MKNFSLALLCSLVFVSFGCLAQVDSLNHKKDWTISLSVGNAGISQSVFDLWNDAEDSRFFYDQFNADYFKIQKYSFGFGITKEFNKICMGINIEKGSRERTVILGDLEALYYAEGKITEKYFSISAEIFEKILVGKLIIKTGLSVPLLLSDKPTFHEYSILKDSSSNIISESTVDYEYPNLFSYGIGIINEFNYPVSSTISLGSCISYYLLVTDQSGEKKGTVIASPLYNAVTLNTMHQKTKSVSFSGIDLKIKLLINLKNLFK